ncbi:MAG TPA: lipopolysaccharide heptosyltransferase II [Candidatus Binataceae bacterium]|nr:lipopolysaccharide heptosyltransferase II [Candidatus Binataceae bacterium]
MTSTFAQSAPHLSALRALESAPRRVIVKEVNWLGDLVMSLPALRAIRREFSQAHLAVLVKKELASFFDGASWIDEVIPYVVRGGLAGIFDRRRTVGEVRSRSFDLAILFPRSFESAFWMTMARVPRRAGFVADARGAMLTHRAVAPPAAMAKHQVHYWLSMIHETLGISGDAGDYAVDVHEANRDRMREWLGAHRKAPRSRLIAIAPAAAYGPAKEWPAENYGALIDLLAERYDADCVLVGAPSERARCEDVVRASRIDAAVAAGETTIGELIAMLSLSDAFIGNDSGCMHLAGALGIPTVAIFGSTNPDRTGPLGPRTRVIYHRLECSPCLARTCRFGHYNCLRQVVPGEVADALLALNKPA